jgi:hypothetical protein
VYSAVIPITCTWLAAILGVIAAVQEVTDLPYAMMMWVSVLLPWVWMVVYWWAAIRSYLRVRHGLATSILLTLLAALFVGAVLFWVLQVPIWRPFFDLLW